MASSIWGSLLLSALSLQVADGDKAQVAIDILPDDARNVVDTASPDAVEVAILGSAELDPASIDPASLRLAGAESVKGSSGESHALIDVNADGRLDLVVWFPARALRLSALDTSAVLTGATRDGRLLTGRDAIRTLEAARRGEGPPPLSEQKFSTRLDASSIDAPRPPGGSIRYGSTAPVVSSLGQYPGGITIFDSGPASVYPATLSVAGASGVVAKLRVTLNGIRHTCYNDLDILLVGPTGQSLVLSSDTGGCGNPATFTNITFDDFAGAVLSPFTSALPQGSYRTSNNGSGDVFPAPAPAPSAAASLSAFNGTNPNGTWSLYVFDDAPGDAGLIRDGWTIDIVTMTQFCSAVPIAVPGTGVAAPYPSTITVSGLPAQLAKVTVTLKGVTSQTPDNLDILLQPPSSPPYPRALVMSDVGGSTPVSDVDVTLDDDFNLLLPQSGGIPWSGTYRPTDYEPGDVLPAPAPVGASGSSLSALVGTNPNGTWQLWVADDTAGGAASSLAGWCLNITAIPPSDTCLMQPISVPDSGAAAPYPSVMPVVGTSGLVQRLRVDLLGITHSYPADLDVVLQAPSGETLALMSDAGGSTDVINHDIRLDTEVATYVPEFDPLGHGPYIPSDYDGGDGDLFPAPAPQQPFDCCGMYDERPNGNWKLWVQDDASQDLGSIAGWCLSFALSQPIASGCVGGPTSMTIPSGAPFTTIGTASPYPWTIPVNAEGTVVGRVVVRLENFSHTYPDDVDILLVGPQGQAALIMSDAGGDADVDEDHITLDDNAPLPLPDNGPLTTGTYRPSDYLPADGNFAAPAPVGPYASSLGVFQGTAPNGNWNLYVSDDAGSDWGGINRFCIDIYPLYPSGEVTRVRWNAGAKSSLAWDGAPNTTNYYILRGTGADLPGLSSSATDHCVAASEHRQIADYLTSTPPPGTLFWYLVVGENGGVRGPAGSTRIAGTERARIVESTGSCAAP